ncbi:F-box family protein [Striga asiatica]|uniref:F-box family protein n=1 Tax=Striga asiatica TaxID=4170 RepID=A0A5A7QJQ5_STRAF|nr:F-box family protein [Striga asiatica]
MDDQTSWISQCVNTITNGPAEPGPFSDLIDNTNKELSSISMNLILPDDLLERILSHLPVASLIRARSVCKKWNGLVTSKTFLCNNNNPQAQAQAQKPWYFMFTSSDEPTGFAFDPSLKKWHALDLPRIESPNWFVSSSSGLVCFMDNETRAGLYVCNPITGLCQALQFGPGPKSPDYSTLAILADRAGQGYEVSVVMSKQVPSDFYRWDLSIHLYESGSGSWATAHKETLTGWRAGDESVICGGSLCFLIYSTGGFGPGPESRHGLVLYDLEKRAREVGPVLMRSFVPVPCALTCGRLMNLDERLVMVGGIGRHDRPDIIKGIGIWALKGREWEEVARMPHRYFQGFGELDDVFASSGTGGIVYIQSYGAPALLIFDFKLRQWKWAQKCPVAKRFPLQLFTGFCFEPRLEISP